jgi:putative ABC transport system substrate-binding protein
VKRREFITLLGGAAAWPLGARGQQSLIPVVGFLHTTGPEAYASFVAAFRRGLNETGFVEGRNLAIEFRWAHDETTRLPELAVDLVRRRVAVIVTPAAAAARAAKAATSTIPIVFGTGSDPVQLGLVASINRPGGNATGVVQFNDLLINKRLELLRELVPMASVIGLLVNPGGPTTELRLASVEAAARGAGQQLRNLTVTSPDQFEAAFATIAQERIAALLVPNNTLFLNHRAQLVALAARYAVPAAYEHREYVEAGGLFSYGSSQSEYYVQLGSYTGRILKGEKPAEMPVMQPTKFEFILNLKTAKALGLDVPLKLYAFADEVIE